MVLRAKELMIHVLPPKPRPPPGRPPLPPERTNDCQPASVGDCCPGLSGYGPCPGLTEYGPCRGPYSNVLENKDDQELAELQLQLRRVLESRQEESSKELKSRNGPPVDGCKV